MRAWTGFLLLGWVLSTSAATVEMFSPQGTSKSVRQVQARFSQPVVALGDPRAADPFEVNCPATGSGKWLDDRVWVYDFARDLPGAVRCEFKLRAGLKDAAGQAVKAETFQFDTGGPQVSALRPFEGDSAIDERQAFVLVFDAAVKPGTLARHASCRVSGLAERIEVEVLQGAARETALQPLKANNDPLFRRRFAPNAATTEVLRCKRPLPNEVDVSLVIDPGVEASNGLVSQAMQTFAFKVRPAFRARAVCGKLNARAACNPLAAIRVDFGGAIRREDARQVRLAGPDGRTWTAKADDDGSDNPWVDNLRFAGPFPEKATLSLSLPAGMRDEDGRTLVNAALFPLAIRTDDFPPLAKFSASFGVLEAAHPVLPVTLRNLETGTDHRSLAVPGKLAAVREGGDSMVIGWLTYLESVRYGRDVPNANKKKPPTRQPAGSFSVLAKASPLAEFAVPKPGGAEAFEVIGIPLAGPGFYVVELASPKLGAAYLDGRTPFHTHTAALVTNLVAHFKAGRESSLVWVTALDSGQPVADAQVAVSDCNGKVKWQGSTDAQGRARIAQALGEAKRCRHWPGGWFVSARVDKDRTFTLSSWDNGIESWRFNLPSSDVWTPEIAHSVLDRSLFRAGDTVAMKHFIRLRSGRGFALPAQKTLPKKLTLTHVGSGQSTTLPVTFDRQGIADTQWAIPREARLGAYDILLGEGANAHLSGQFTVAAFRLPTMRAQISLPQAELVRAPSTHVDIGVQYLSGGGASLQPVKLRSLVEPARYRSTALPDATFANGTVKEGVTRDDTVGDSFYELEDGADPVVPPTKQALARTQAATLDQAGAARLTVSGLPQADTLQTLQLELDYQDASGVTQTVSRRATLWPGQRIPGIAIRDWNARDKMRYTLAVIDPNGKPVAGARVESDIFTERTFSHRKRLIGGFYAYENTREVKRVAAGCAGETNARGQLACAIKPPARGNLIVRVKTTDAAGRSVYAHRDMWVAGSDDAWFPGDDSDRMDVLPEQPKYEPGQTAELQVKLPFHSATALVTVEREGVLDSFVVPLSASSPTVRLPIKPNYAPNVVVSVLAVRGRVGEPAPTALLDLGKPAYKLGAASLRVGERGHALKVSVSTPSPVYKVREHVPVSVKVTRADGGKLPAGAEVALAAVDEGLLELAPNTSWKLLDAMMAKRPWEVETATAQMQVVGKRHYGRKSLPPGGGGGKLPTRELFDTRVLWQARVKLDANGRAQVTVPLNDSLTSFRIVAVAHAGTGFFGDGDTRIQTRQDVMLLAGLPPVVREGDAFAAGFTVRNGSDRPQKVTLTPALSADGSAMALSPQTVTLAAGEARSVSWPVIVPAGVGTLVWTLKADSAGGSDALKQAQQVMPAVPTRVMQATLLQLDGSHALPVARPADALAGRGGVAVSVAPTLSGNLADMRDFMRTYPYTCIEQRVSRALALDDANLWKDAAARLSAHLDRNGLLRFFASEALPGDAVLTAYVLATAHAARQPLPEAARDAMLDGLEAFVAGRLRTEGIGFADGHLRKLSAIEALARYGRATPDMLDALALGANQSVPNAWPTSALIDMISILQRLASVPDREAKLKQAVAQLRARMDLRGTTLNWSGNTRDDLWWLMVSPDLNAARALAVLQMVPEMQADLPRIARGLMARQQQGRWDLTTANAWARIALDRFSTQFDAAPVKGETRAELAGASRTLAWPKPQAVELPWPATPGELRLTQQGSGKPWVTVSSRAAVPLKTALESGYSIQQSVTPVQQATPGTWTRGDLARVTLTIDAQADMSWVVVDAPIPAGASVLGSGLAGESSLLDRGSRQHGAAWLAFEERPFDRYRAYYAWVPKGRFTLDYTLRLNNPGHFKLPATRVEAMYQPEQFGERPNADWDVMP
ncbi:MAG: MG2 domain-containing protein [Thiobacillus sp.]